MLLDKLDHTTKHQPTEVKFDDLPLARLSFGKEYGGTAEENVRVSCLDIPEGNSDKSPSGKKPGVARRVYRTYSGEYRGVFFPPCTWKENPEMVKKDWLSALEPEFSKEDSIYIYETTNAILGALKKDLYRKSGDDPANLVAVNVGEGDKVLVFSPILAGKKHPARPLVAADLAFSLFRDTLTHNIRLGVADGMKKAVPITAAGGWKCVSNYRREEARRRAEARRGNGEILLGIGGLRTLKARKRLCEMVGLGNYYFDTKKGFVVSLGVDTPDDLIRRLDDLMKADSRPLDGLELLPLVEQLRKALARQEALNLEEARMQQVTFVEEIKCM